MRSGIARRSSLRLTVLTVSGIACTSREPAYSAQRLPQSLEHDLIAKVIEQTVLGISETDAQGNPVIWRDWWYTIVENHVQPSPALLAHFRQASFDIDHPPPRPDRYPSQVYQVRRLQWVSDHLLKADIGPAYAGCRYTFRRSGTVWTLRDDESDRCWIS
jgi:hypothetical protein